jgi:hypothetical protein
LLNVYLFLVSYQSSYTATLYSGDADAQASLKLVVPGCPKYFVRYFVMEVFILSYSMVISTKSLS